MSNQSRSGTIALFIGAVSSTLLLCCWLSLARSAAEQIASDRLQNIQKAQAKLQQQETADWSEVISADKAEIAALNSATTAAMKAGNADAVEAAQKLLKTVKTRLAEEKALTTFPPNFQSATNTTGQQNPVLKIELARNKAVVSAVAQVKKAQLTCHDAVVAADQAAITQWKQQIAAAMKAGNPQAVVTDMSAMKQLRQQLQQDSMSARNGFTSAVTPVQALPGFKSGGSPLGINAIVQNPTAPTYRPPGFFPGTGQPALAGDQSQLASTVGGIPSAMWPTLVTQAMKPVPWNGVPSLAATLKRYQSNPKVLLGMKVIAYVTPVKSGDPRIKGSRGPVPDLTAADRLRVRNIRHSVLSYFDSVIKAVAAQERSEYQTALEDDESQAGRNAVMAGVSVNEQIREQRAAAKIVVPAIRAEHKDLRAIGMALRPPRNRIAITDARGQHPPSQGAIYGVVVGISEYKSPVSLPGFSYYYVINPTNPSILRTKPSTLQSEHVYFRVMVLYCARAPHYFSPAKKGPTGPIKSYVFKMKSGTKMEATTYTTGSFYYHLKWNGINLLVAKDLVVRIQTVR